MLLVVGGAVSCSLFDVFLLVCQHPKLDCWPTIHVILPLAVPELNPKPLRSWRRSWLQLLLIMDDAQVTSAEESFRRHVKVEIRGIIGAIKCLYRV